LGSGLLRLQLGLLSLLRRCASASACARAAASDPGCRLALFAQVLFLDSLDRDQPGVFGRLHGFTSDHGRDLRSGCFRA